MQFPSFFLYTLSSSKVANHFSSFFFDFFGFSARMAGTLASIDLFLAEKGGSLGEVGGDSMGVIVAIFFSFSTFLAIPVISALKAAELELEGEAVPNFANMGLFDAGGTTLAAADI
jgi:hypothetical protein